MLVKGLATLEGPDLEFKPKAGYGDQIDIAMPEVKDGYVYQWKDPRVKKALIRQANMFIKWAMTQLKAKIGHTKEWKDIEALMKSGQPGLRNQANVNRLLSLLFKHWHTFDLSKSQFQY
jgi:hypothetical protein